MTTGPMAPSPVARASAVSSTSTIVRPLEPRRRFSGQDEVASDVSIDRSLHAKEHMRKQERPIPCPRCDSATLAGLASDALLAGLFGIQGQTSSQGHQGPPGEGCQGRRSVEPALSSRESGCAFGGKVLKSGHQSVESLSRTQALSLLCPACERRLGLPAWSPFPFLPSPKSPSVANCDLSASL